MNIQQLYCHQVVFKQKNAFLVGQLGKFTTTFFPNPLLALTGSSGLLLKELGGYGNIKVTGMGQENYWGRGEEEEEKEKEETKGPP